MPDQPSPDRSDKNASSSQPPTPNDSGHLVPDHDGDIHSDWTPSESGSASGLREGSDIHRSLPQPAVGRLSLYYRELHRLSDSGTQSVNSRELGKLVDVSPAVVRRDLSALGTIGRRGVGYAVPALIEAIGMVLGSGLQWRVVLVGAGSLGDALLRYRGFERLGFQLMAAFDVDPAKIGTEIGGVKVRDASEIDETLKESKPHLAILAVPAEKAALVANQLVAGGISGVLNFAPMTLRLAPGIAVVNVDLASELQRLAFSVQHGK